MITERIHSLDALRAFALLLGVSLHSALCFVLPPGFWAVGTTEGHPIPSLFVYYVHCFRMEVFFLLAGFFSRLVIRKRGTFCFLRERAIRIVLVFIIALYPMKLLLASLWMLGGQHTGWLPAPEGSQATNVWRLAFGAVTSESWPAINLTHLWFLYYLACITALFLGARQLATLVFKSSGPLRHAVNRCFRRALSSCFAPVLLALMTLPLLGFMTGFDVDTPDMSFAWHWPVLGLYGLFFVFGWLLFTNTELLAVLSRRCVIFLPASLVVGCIAAAGVGAQLSNLTQGIETSPALRWFTALGTSLTMNLAVLGWLGLFVRLFSQQRTWVRYLADSSYWIYLVHLPLVVVLQISFAKSTAPWWVQLPLINAIAFTLLLLSYHGLVRSTWIGAWLNGRRPARLEAATSALPKPATATAK